jgi:uncharacterized damage-inducible protein DinB
MALETLKLLFKRDLNKLKKEIELYHSEQNIWRVDKNITNTAGNLCLHLVGNLQAYIGAEIGRTGYVRQRDLEFSLKNIGRQELLQKIEETILVIDQALSQIKEEDLQQEYPLQVFEEKTSVEFFLIHLATHLSYHLGQINYHRRLLDD